MRTVLTTISILFFAGCKGGSTPDPGPSVYSFKTASAPDSVTADVSLATADAWDAASGLLGMVSLISTDFQVRELLGSSASPGPACWLATPLNSITINLDFDACQLIQATGDVTVARLPLGGAIAYQIDPGFSYNNRSIPTGEFVFTPIDSIRWLTSTAPWVDPMAPPAETVRVAINGRMMDVSIEGRAQYGVFDTAFTYWGRMTVTGDNGTQEIWYGAETLDDAQSEAAPDSALVDALFDECRCATSGIYALPTTLKPSVVMMDLSRSLDEGGTVWPIIPIDTTDTVEGVVIVRPGGQCGRLRGDFVPAEDDALVLSGDEVRAGIERACSENKFSDEAQCEQMRAAAAGMTEHTINLGERVATEMVKEMVERLMDPGFCSP